MSQISWWGLSPEEIYDGFHLSEDLSILNEWDWKVSPQQHTAAAAWNPEIQKSRNPLIQRFYSGGIIPSVTFSVFTSLLCIHLASVWFPPTNQLCWTIAVVVNDGWLNVASGQLATSKIPQNILLGTVFTCCDVLRNSRWTDELCTRVKTTNVCVWR